MTANGSPSPPIERRRRVPNDDQEIKSAEDEILSAAQSCGFGQEPCFALRLALEEAIRNAFHHGHAERPEEPIDLAWSVSPDRIEITIEDRGPGFDPSDVPDPTADENLDRPCGRGLLLMRAYMTHVEHNERGNQVRMVYEPGA